jgi:hypothetical protein
MDYEFNARAIQIALNACVNEMYDTDKGMPILRPDEEIFCVRNVRATRKQVKHIIEQRKADGKSIEEIKMIIGYLPILITNPDFEIFNPNQTHPGSVMRVKMFKMWQYGVVVVLDREMNDLRDLITAYPQRPISVYFLLLKKLNTSAAGKTPHPQDIPEG